MVVNKIWGELNNTVHQGIYFLTPLDIETMWSLLVLLFSLEIHSHMQVSVS